MWEMTAGKLTKIDDLVAQVKANLELADTVCLLGGEPTDQLEGLIELAKKLRDIPVYMWLYTGREIEYLVDLGITEYFDVIKCGPYRKDIPATSGSRLASGNQKIYYISRKEI